MKPHIIIAIHYMHLGGAEISLVGLLQSLDPDKVDIDLFVYSHEGCLLKFIPKYVNLLPETKLYSMFERPMLELFRKGFWSMLAARLWSKFKTRQYVKHASKTANDSQVEMGYLGKYVSKIVHDINPSVEYDLAISFLTPHNFVCDHVCAKKKICWIHTDYSSVDVNTELELPIWGSFDNIISISQNVTDAFISKFPSLTDKIVMIENILSSDFVRKRAEEVNVGHEFSGDINLLSIGRLTYPKNFDSIPEICKALIGYGYNIKWYIIGYGSDEPFIRKKIIEAGMQDYVSILGKKENPYPYIKACDIYVQPSRYEGKSVSVREAQILCKPVVVTNYPTASSQIQDGIDGVIVPMDNESCAKSLAGFILDIDKQKRIIEYLRLHDYGNVQEIQKIYNIIGFSHDT